MGVEPVRAVGAILIFAGLPVLVDSFARFVIDGLGTPAPPAPMQRLVVAGFYQHVRNPMYAAIVVTILGQALLHRARRELRRSSFLANIQAQLGFTIL